VTQLPLPLRWAPEFDLGAFLFADQSSQPLIERLVQTQEHQALMIVGPSNAGKSYLLRAIAARRTGSDVCTTAQVNRPANARLFGVDNVEALLGNSDDEEWLFHDFNRAVDLGIPWVGCAREAPANLGFTLPDLRSRLMQAILLRLPVINDTSTRHALLRQQAAGLGVALEDGVLSYLETHVTRDLSKLTQWLRRLNEHSLSKRKKISIASVRELLKLDAATRSSNSA
jgi:DnaA-homolog protein